MPFLFIFFIFLAGCHSSPPSYSYFNPKLPEEASHSFSLLAKVAQIEKQDFPNIRIETLAKDKLSSHHLVVIREQEPLHYHAKHDAWALVLKGEADFILGDNRIRLVPGSAVYIPRGVHHQATRRGKGALAAFVIFTPPYDGKDMVPVEKE